MIRNRAYARRAAVVGALVALFMLVSVGTLWAAEYVVNGGFESGLDSWEYGGMGDPLVWVTMDQAHSGSWSMQINAYEGTAYALQYLTITPGIVYSFSFWSQGDWLHSMEVFVSSDLVDACDINTSSDGNAWAENGCSFSFDPSDPGPYQVEFFIQESEYAEGAMGYVDDVSIVEGESIPPSNDESTNASTCLMLLLIKISVAMVVFFAVVSLGMWLGQINIF